MKIKYVISREEAIRKGYQKNSRGTYCKKTVLDRYYELGYLDLPNSKYSAKDRKSAGEKLAHDFFLAHYNDVKTIALYADKIPTTGECGRDIALFFQDRYLSAVKNVPYEFWPVVRLVCIEDKEIKGDDVANKQSLRNKNSVYYQKMLLNLGLERLLKFYLQKNKKSS